MNQTFFSSPLWQKFHGRSLTVYRLSDGEHRLRDAHANILLKEFLPGNTRFETFVIDGGREPKFAMEEASVILGRPSLFPKRVRTLLECVQPKLFYHFASDEKSDISDYRSIVRRGLPKLEEIKGQPFVGQRKAKPEKLIDHAIVYSGWCVEQPVMLLAGSSAVGTWAAVNYVTKSPLPNDGAIWQQDIQGVIRGKVWAEEEAFDDVESDTHELLSPCRFWMEGGSRPQADGWKRDVLQLGEHYGPKGMDLRIVVNGKTICTKARTFVPALVLLAWLSHRTSSYHEGFCAEITPREALHALFSHLQIRKDNPIDLGERHKPVDSLRSFTGSKIGKHICETLKELTDAIRKAGGLACAEENSKGQENEDRWIFRIVSRELPHFFPKIR